VDSLGNLIGVGLGGLGAMTRGNAARGAGGQLQMYGLLSAMMQQQMFQQAQNALNPFIQGGQGAFNALLPLIGANPGGNPLTAPLTRPFQPTMAQLEQTPGYQFTLEQGLNAVNNSMASRGLGQSGNALAAAAQYASGLASNTYQQQFQDYWTNNMNAFNQLAGVGQQGASSANALAGAATQTGANIGNSLMQAGQGLASGTLGQGTAMGNFFSGLGGLSLLGNGGTISNPFSSLFNNSYMNSALGSMGGGLNSFFGNALGGFNGPYGLPSG